MNASRTWLRKPRKPIGETKRKLDHVAEKYGEIQVVPGGAKIGIGGVGLFGNKRPYITITDGATVYTLGSLHPRVTPEQFWQLMEKVIGRPIVDEVRERGEKATDG